MIIDTIKKYELCLGCGLCESILTGGKCKMAISEKGFYIPELTSVPTKDEERIIRQLCPGIHVEAKSNKGAWGSMKAIAEAWSSDEQIRFKAASGGVVSSLALYLLEKKKVDAVFQVGVCEDSYLYNELKISRTREDVMRNSQSRYAPAMVFNKIIQYLDANADTYAFIGKPCDIAAARNLVSTYPKYAKRIKYYISIFCAGMPSYEATKITWKQSGHIDAPISLKYRGDGWPGNFSAAFKDGTKYEITYNESWGTVLNRHLPYRCKICPDGIGMLADIAVGDSWDTKDGYPDFTESQGRCFCMIRTEAGQSLMKEAEENGYIIVQKLDIDTIKEKQQYQYERRKLTGWRLLPLQLFTLGLLNFKGLGIMKQAKELDFRKGINNMKGALIRLIKVTWGGVRYDIYNLYPCRLNEELRVSFV